MSVNEWGTLREPTIPVPDLDEPSDSARRAERVGDSDGDLLDNDTYGDNSHLSVDYMGEQWLLPGGGEPGDNCQIWKPEAVCNQCGHVDLVQEHCDSWECPHCDGGVMARFAVNVATRIQSYRYTQPDDYRRQWAHAVVDAAEGDVTTRRGLFENRTKAADIAIEKGFRGCAVIAHSHRATPVGKQLYREHVDRDDDGEPTIGFWVWIRSDPPFPTSELIEWDPHYHILGPTSAGMTEGKESDEWNYHVIRFNEYELGSIADSVNSHRELYTTGRYLASHIMQPGDCDRQRVTWHGDLANSVFVQEASEEWQCEKPSQGAIDAIKRRMGEIAEEAIDRDDGDESGSGDDSVGDCPRSRCDGDLIAAWDINAYLDQADPPPDVVETMRVVRDWVGGDLQLPAGLCDPRREADAELALEKLVPSYSRHGGDDRRNQTGDIKSDWTGESSDPVKSQDDGGIECLRLQPSMVGTGLR